MDRKNKNLERELLKRFTRESRASLRMNRIMLNIYQTDRPEILFYAKSKSNWYKEKLKISSRYDYNSKYRSICTNHK